MIKTFFIVIGLVVVVSAAGFIFGILNKDQSLISPDNQTTPLQTATSSPSLDSLLLCTNNEKKYTIGYPSEWSVSGSGVDSCTVFIPPAGNSTIKVEIGMKPDSFNSLKATLGTSDETRLLLSKKQIEVGKESAQKIEVENTGIGNEPKGTRAVYYLIEGNQPGVISYVETGANPLREETLKILEQMVGTFNLIAN